MSTDAPEDRLYARIERTIVTARGSVARSVNLAMVHAYWLIGRNIVEVEQAGDPTPEYGKGITERLSKRLTRRFGRGFGVRTVRRIRQFYLTFPHGSQLLQEASWKIRSAPLTGSDLERAWMQLQSESSMLENRSAALTDSPTPLLFPPELGWSHYLLLLGVQHAEARAFYEIEAANEGWTTRQLERQINTLLYERLAKSRDKEGVLALAREGQQVTTPGSMLKDPLILEFLDLPERALWRERELEQAIIDRLESFLLELGKGFCFVARQKRITLDGDHYFVDLVFYNRLLRCFVLVDLKLNKLTHQDLGQMQMYVNLYDQTQRIDGEAPTVGIVLCSEKNDAMVRITLPADSQVHASRYQMYLPTEAELSAELARERSAAEDALRIAAREAGDE